MSHGFTVSEVKVVWTWRGVVTPRAGATVSVEVDGVELGSIELASVDLDDVEMVVVGCAWGFLKREGAVIRDIIGSGCSSVVDCSSSEGSGVGEGDRDAVDWGDDEREAIEVDVVDDGVEDMMAVWV